MAAPGVARALAESDHRSILVVGDVMLDEYQWGSSERLLPDSAAPVIELERCDSALGGAGNAAANAAGLGADTYLVGVTGADDAAAMTRDMANRIGVTCRFVELPNRPTSRKARIYANGRPVARLDREVRRPVGAETVTRLLDASREVLGAVDVLLVSDYAKGTVTEPFAAALLAEARNHQLLVVVDTKRQSPNCYRGCDAVTPNVNELERWVGRALPTSPERSVAAVEFTRRLDCRFMLLTEGSEGMTLYSREGSSHFPARTEHVVDSSGAGDTMAVTFALGLSAGLRPREAAELANDAAGVVVQRQGTSPISLTALSNARWGQGTD